MVQKFHVLHIARDLVACLADIVPAVDHPLPTPCHFLEPKRAEDRGTIFFRPQMERFTLEIRQYLEILDEIVALVLGRKFRSSPSFGDIVQFSQSGRTVLAELCLQKTDYVRHLEEVESAARSVRGPGALSVAQFPDLGLIVVGDVLFRPGRKCDRRDVPFFQLLVPLHCYCYQLSYASFSSESVCVKIDHHNIFRRDATDLDRPFGNSRIFCSPDPPWWNFHLPCTGEFPLEFRHKRGEGIGVRAGFGDIS